MTVIVPAFLVGMALMVLIWPVPSNVRAIEMSPFASETGENFDVLVGGGAAFKGSLTSRQDMAMLYDELSSGLNARSEGLGIFHLPKAKSSQIMSDRLLESYYYHGDITRAGAFVLHDEITLAVSIDWPFYKKFLRHLVNVTLNRIELLKDIIIPKEDFENNPALQLGCRWRSARVFILSKHRVYDAASCVRRRSGWETDRVLPKGTLWIMGTFCAVGVRSPYG